LLKNIEKESCDFLGQLNFTSELCQLLEFTSNVAIAIRMNSAYHKESMCDPETPHNVLWLSDCLHNFSYLSDAINLNDTEKIIIACDNLLQNYKWYYENHLYEQYGHDSKTIFERYSQRVELKDAMKIFEQIKSTVKMQDPEYKTNHSIYKDAFISNDLYVKYVKTISEEYHIVDSFNYEKWRYILYVLGEKVFNGLAGLKMEYANILYEVLKPGERLSEETDKRIIKYMLHHKIDNSHIIDMLHKYHPSFRYLSKSEIECAVFEIQYPLAKFFFLLKKTILFFMK